MIVEPGQAVTGLGGRKAVSPYNALMTVFSWRGRVLAGSAVVLAIALSAVSPARSQSDSVDSDLAFLRKLAEAQRGVEVDRPRLARLFADVAAILDANKASVNRLRRSIPPRDPNLESVTALLEGQ